MNNSSFVGMFPPTRKRFTLVGALKGVAVDPLNCSGLFLIKPLHTFSAGHYSGPAVHNEGCWNLWSLRSASTKLSDFRKLVEYQPDPEVPSWPKVPRRDQMIRSQPAFSPFPHWSIRSKNEIDWKNPATAQPGTEGIIVLIVLILCPTPPPPSNSTHHSPPPPHLLLCVLSVLSHRSPDSRAPTRWSRVEPLLFITADNLAAARIKKRWRDERHLQRI